MLYQKCSLIPHVRYLYPEVKGNKFKFFVYISERVKLPEKWKKKVYRQ